MVDRVLPPLRKFQGLPNTNSLAKPTRTYRIWPLSISSTSSSSTPSSSTPPTCTHTHTYTQWLLFLKPNKLILSQGLCTCSSYTVASFSSSGSSLKCPLLRAAFPDHSGQGSPSVTQSHFALLSSSKHPSAPDVSDSLTCSVVSACLPLYSIRITDGNTDSLTAEFPALEWHLVPRRCSTSICRLPD